MRGDGCGVQESGGPEGWGRKGMDGGQGYVGALWARLQRGYGVHWWCTDALEGFRGAQGIGVQGVWGPLPCGVQRRPWGPCNLGPVTCAGIGHPKTATVTCRAGGTPCVPLSRLVPVFGDTAGFGGADTPLPPCQCPPVPQPRGPPNPLPEPRGAVLGSERRFSHKGGSGGGGWCSSSFPAGTKAKQTESVSVSVSVPMSMSSSMPTLLPGLWAKPRGGHRAQPRSGSVPSLLSPGDPPVPLLPLASGRWLFSFGRAVAACPKGATSCRLSVAVVAQTRPWSPGCPIPDGWVAPRRWHRPPKGALGSPGWWGMRCSPGSAWRGLSEGLSLVTFPPRVPRNLP